MLHTILLTSFFWNCECFTLLVCAYFMVTVRVASQWVADGLKVPRLPVLVAPVKHQTGKDRGGEWKDLSTVNFSNIWVIIIKVHTSLPPQEAASPGGGAWRDDHSLAHTDPRVSEDGHTKLAWHGRALLLPFRNSESTGCSAAIFEVNFSFTVYVATPGGTPY